MTMHDSFQVTDNVSTTIRPYVQAMLNASGLNEFDAVTSVLFAITTHLELDMYPILVYLGSAGTGKSAAMKQLFPMCKGSKWITGNTLVAQRNQLIDVRTAFLEEADNNLQTDLYTRRFLRQTGSIGINTQIRPGQWQMQTCNIFGATVMHRRVTLADVGLRSRSIIIRTKYRLEGYEQTTLGTDLSTIASSLRDEVNRRLTEYLELDRIWQTWSVLVTIAKALDMNNWENETQNLIVREAEVLRGGQGYEPGEAILRALDILGRDDISHERVDKSVKISEVVAMLREEFALNLTHTQIREEAESSGFEAGILHGYPIIKVKQELMDRLLPEAG